VSFAPISQVFPFLYPMADRYLYFILPGLIGGTLLAGRAGLGRIAGPRSRRHARRAATLLALALLAFFAARSFERARVWSSPALLLADAAIHYPDGVSASLGRARGAAQSGDAETATRSLHAAYQRGFNRFDQIVDDPAFAAVRGDPRFVAVVREMAGAWIEWGRGLRRPSQLELHAVAQAHLARGERDEAAAVLERALAAGGPIDAQVREELASLRGRGTGPRSGSGPP
jgi:tetratricopeptide (TPR) repeat protein